MTGGGSGIGHATAALFAREGARVLVVDLVATRAKSVAAEIQRLGGVAEAFVGDVSLEKDAEEMAARPDELWHRLDILVNNAASFHHKTAKEATRDDWEKVPRERDGNQFLYAVRGSRHETSKEWRHR